MRKILVIILLIFIQLIVINSSNGQNRNAIKFNLLSPIAKTLNLSYERDITNKLSGQIGLSYTTISVTGAKYNGISFTPEYRIYPVEKDNMKTYIAPFGRIHRAKINTQTLDDSENVITEKATFNSIGGGVIFGVKFLFDDIAVLDVYLGPSYSNGEILTESSGEEHFAHFDLVTGLLTGLSFRAGIAIGIVF